MFCNSYLDAYTTAPMIVLEGSSVPIVEGVGQGITLNNNTATLGAGTYLVTFNATISSTVAGTVGVVLSNNGTEISSSDTSIEADGVASVSLSKIVKVLPSCQSINNKANLTVTASGADLDILQADLVVVRIA